MFQRPFLQHGPSDHINNHLHYHWQTNCQSFAKLKKQAILSEAEFIQMKQDLIKEMHAFKFVYHFLLLQ